MRKPQLALLLSLGASLGAQAQISLNAVDNIPFVGDDFPYLTTTYAAPPAAGAGQVFDYSTLVQGASVTRTWIAPDEYSDPAAFPGATMVLAGPADTSFYNVTANGLERVGERQLILGIYDVEVPLSDPSLNLKLPLAYNETWNDNIAATFDLNGDPGSRTGTIFGHADAWGTILLPGGGAPIEVLRVFTFTQEVNSVNPGIPITVTHKRRQYDYYAQFLKTPLLRVYSDSLTSSIGINSNVNAIEWLSPAAVAVAELEAQTIGFNLFPNPAENTIQLESTSADRGISNITVADPTGRVVMQDRNVAFDQPHRMDVGSLAPGTYTITVFDAAGGRGVRHFVKN